MERTPRERVIYDEDYYQGWKDDYFDEGNENGAWGEWKDAVADGSELSFEQYVWDIRQQDYDHEIAQLSAFFKGEKGDMSSFENPLGGNTIIAVGSIGRWDGIREGFTPYKTFEEAIDTSPSWRGADNVFADCEIQRIWDENGHLYVHGAHHDGSVTVELRQLTDAGMTALEAMEDSEYGESFTVAGNDSTPWAFRTYDGSEQSIAEFFHDILDDPSFGFAPLPRYMEQCFECPSEEWEDFSFQPGDVLFENDILKVSATGREYDFIATMENKTARRIVATVMGETFDIAPNDWVGIEADEWGFNAVQNLAVGGHIDISHPDAGEAVYHVSYVKDGISQALLVKASNEREALETFKAVRGGDTEIYGVNLAQSDDMKPGKPVIGPEDRPQASPSLSDVAKESVAASGKLEVNPAQDAHRDAR